MSKVSLVLPSLNVSSYIGECLESVLAQTLRDIEVICVDAGSTDGTEEIIKEFARKDNRVQMLKSEKRSYGYQVNLGMNCARGKYVAIVETDDVVPSYMYEELYNTAESYSVDLVKADFYRFKDMNGRRNLFLEKLSPMKEDYGKVIRPKECKKVFDFPINTWAGIYNRTFLNKYHIRHNESPGASFQDNGFWFQTFIFADTVYFIDKPYYMNRRDNPNSSVYSKGKVFAMCDEYDFLFQILEAHPQVKKEFWPQYVKAKLKVSNFTLKRITYEEKLLFLPKFAQDFRMFIEKNMFSTNQFSDTQLAALFRIVFAEKEYEDLYIKPRLKLYERIRKAGTVIIFGAGKYGRKFYDDLCRDVPNVGVIGFMVTDVRKNDESYRGIKIYDINGMGQYRHNLLVIALGEKNKREVLPLLGKKGFDNIELLPPMVFPLV